MSSDPSTPGVSLNGASLTSSFALFADETRRQLLRLLADTDTPVSLHDLANQLAARTIGGTASEDRIQRLRTAIYHVHLPRLQDAHVVEYDPDQRTVAPGRNLPETLALLHATTD